MFCTQCGARIPDGSKFCMSCGAKLANMPAGIVQDVSDMGEAASADLDASALIDLIEEQAFHLLMKSEHFHNCRDFKDSYERRKYGNIQQIYRQAGKVGEKFLFFYDNTFTNCGKESFLLTDRGIHYTSQRFQTGSIAYSGITDLTVFLDKMFPNLLINDSITIPIRFLSNECYELRDDLEHIVIPLLLQIQRV